MAFWKSRYRISVGVERGRYLFKKVVNFWKSAWSNRIRLRWSIEKRCSADTSALGWEAKAEVVNRKNSIRPAREFLAMLLA